jgi:hypothetical protein
MRTEIDDGAGTASWVLIGRTEIRRFAAPGVLDHAPSLGALTPRLAMRWRGP